MKRILVFLLIGGFSMSCSTTSSSSRSELFTAERGQELVGGQAVIKLGAQVQDPGQPQITGVEILPGRGMNIFQVYGVLPGGKKINVFVAPELKAGDNTLGDAADDTNGNLSFKYGGALLVPYANRIRGKVSSDGKTLKTSINGQETTLPANWSGKKPGALKNAMHGLILDSKIQNLILIAGDAGATATGTLEAGSFNGHWPSETHLDFEIVLKKNLLKISVTAKNVGKQDLPIGMGWHPYFNLPSGNRSQARLKIPAANRLLVDNYDDVFPTGKKEKMAGTAYDFNHADGKALGDLYLDDCFTDLTGKAVAEIRDPEAHYGIRVTGVSPEISAFQVYAPVDKSFIALEPQFNLADPYNHHVWKHHEKTGMAVLKPGETTQYEVELELF
jgi:aldose 1-epimerase